MLCSSLRLRLRDRGHPPFLDGWVGCRTARQDTLGALQTAKLGSSDSLPAPLHSAPPRQTLFPTQEGRQFLVASSLAWPATSQQLE